MKIATKELDYDQVLARKRPKHKNPKRPSILLASLIRLLSIPDMHATHFTYTWEGKEKLKKRQPFLILMNHSSFIDLKIASKIFYPKTYGIVCTSDGFVGFGMPLLMRHIGCIPTQKFVTDVRLIRDMEYMLKKRKKSILMYPEASYSFDGTATPLPRKMGVLLKKLGVPVVTVTTQGAFARQPLYNDLKTRKVQVSAKVKVLASAEELKTMSVAQLDAMLDEVFSFDNFKWQQDNQVMIDEPFRADGLNRILYRCPHCQAEGKTQGKGITLTCHNCGKVYTLTETGSLKAKDGDSAFTHIPDWYLWQRQQVRKELEAGTYRLETDVKIGMLVDYKAIYMVGEGKLTHDSSGFHLTGCDGRLDYSQGPLACYSVYADYNWYEIGDMICIGNHDVLYYCFPQNDGDVVSKTRIAVEELYKLNKKQHRVQNEPEGIPEK